MLNVEHITHRSKTFLEHLKNDIRGLHHFLGKSTSSYNECANAIDRQIKSFSSNTIAGFFDDPSGICVSFAILRDNFMLFARFYNESFSFNMKDLEDVDKALQSRIYQLKNEGTLKMMDCLVRPMTETKETMSKADANYNKACREMEDALKNKFKAEKDPSYIYDLAYQRRVKENLKKTESDMKEKRQNIIEKVGEYNEEQKQVIAIHEALVSDLEAVREEIMNRVRIVLYDKHIYINEGLQNFEQLIQEKNRILFENKISLDITAEEQYAFSLGALSFSDQRLSLKVLMKENLVNRRFIQATEIETIPEKLEAIASYYSNLFKERASLIKHFVKLIEVAARQEENLAKTHLKLVKQIKELKFNNESLKEFIIVELERMQDCHTKLVLFIRKNIIPACKPLYKNCSLTSKQFNEEIQEVLRQARRCLIQNRTEEQESYSSEQGNQGLEGELTCVIPSNFLAVIINFRDILNTARLKSIVEIESANTKVHAIANYQRTFATQLAQLSSAQVEYIKNIHVEGTVEETLIHSSESDNNEELEGIEEEKEDIESRKFFIEEDPDQFKIMRYDTPQFGFIPRRSLEREDVTASLN